MVKVMKFGGSILSSPQDVERICRIIESEEDRKIIILSAMNGVTDHLESILSFESLESRYVESFISDIERDHLNIINECIHDPGIRSDLSSGIVEIIRDLRITLCDIHERKKIPLVLRDRFLTSGEKLAVLLLDGALRDRGLESVRLGSEDIGLIVSGAFGNGTVDLEASRGSVFGVIDP